MPALTNIVAAAVISLAATTAKPPENSGADICTALGVLAQQAMLARQAGVPMSTLLGMVRSEPAGFAEVARSIVIAAYETPRFSTPTVQRRAAEDHRDWAERECFAGLRDG